MGVNYGRSHPEHMGGSYRFAFPSANKELAGKIVQAQEERQKFLEAQEEEARARAAAGGGSATTTTTTPTTPTGGGGGTGGRSFPRMPMTPRQQRRQQQRSERDRILAMGPVPDPVWGHDLHPGSHSHWIAAGGSEEGWNAHMNDLNGGGGMFRRRSPQQGPQQEPEPDPNDWGQAGQQAPSQPSGPAQVPSLFGGDSAPAKSVMRRINRDQRAAGLTPGKPTPVPHEVQAKKAAKKQAEADQAEQQNAPFEFPIWLT